MSIQALNWAFNQDVRPSAAKFVLVCLANRVSSEGHCWTSQKRLARDTSQSDRSVREHLSTLEELGLLTRTQRRRKDGTRASDGFDLNWQEDKWKVSPVDATAGKSRRTNRKISPGMNLTTNHQELSRARATRHRPKTGPRTLVLSGANTKTNSAASKFGTCG